MSEKIEHSPTPWEVVPSCDHHGPYIVTEYGSSLADLYTMSDLSSASVRNGGTSKPLPFIDADANAAFIVRAVNSFDLLVSSIKSVIEEGDAGEVRSSTIMDLKEALKLAGE